MYGFVGGDVRNSVLTAQLFFWCIFVRCPYTILVSNVKISMLM
ncbi:hypothetical protein MtrunA17_Chr5g0412861 [Medicago truncatula]|uniref:Transmembrane protein n=1 Tax=Medicago truncatula TaxID=3880 RepID=A0A396HQY4_MEDTR|nr:hypothetical protein MtrunA17_Chr5g0412861 [Medicago truncatula]